MGKQSQGIRRTVRLAWGLSRSLGHSEVGTEHLLIALTMEPTSILQCLLQECSLSSRELTAQLVAQRGRGSRIMALPQGFSPAAERAIARSATESETLFSALLQETNGACRLLTRCAVAPERLLTEIYEGYNARKERIMQNTRLLDQFAIDLVEQAEKSDGIIGRQREIETVLQILSRRQKNNPALIGEPGVGKTAIVEGVAQYIAAGRVPEPLRGKRLLMLDMASIIAGTKYRGEFEERIRDILAEVKKAQNVILFLDEMHTLVGAGAAEGAIDAANLLKPALGRGELQLIGATTLTEYRRHIEKDAALERRFRTVQVREPTPAETREILEGLRPHLESYHHMSISDSALHAAVTLSCRYLPDKFLPDKAVDLLDEGAACAGMRRAMGGSSEADRALEDALHEAVRRENYEQAARLRDRMTKRKKSHPGTVSVEAGDIAAVVSSRTGIPVGSLCATEKQRLQSLEETLSRRVIGQDAAIRAAAEAVRRGRSGLAEEKRPVAAMLFTGPTGVGKTELCKALAVAVYGSEKSMIRVDMSEYMEKFSVSRLIGAPPGYVGHEEGGQLSERVRRQPYSLVLLDELEKAHPDICGLLLQILEDGILTDSEGRQVDFRSTLLVMTSNLGSAFAGKGALGFGAAPEDLTRRALREHFPPELLGRIDCIAAFRPLAEPSLEKIAGLQLTALQQRAEKQHLTLCWQPEVATFLAKQCVGKESGARALRHLLRETLEAPLALRLLSECVPSHVTVTVEKDGLHLS